MRREGGRSLGEATYDTLVAMLSSCFPPGTRLPSENALARRLAVSRPVLRQALARLQAEGRVGTRKGSGSIALAGRPPLALPFGPLDSIPDVRAFLDFRCSLEREVAAHAARNATRSHLGAIREALRAFERRIAAGGTAVEEDIGFHAAIAHASGNRFFVAVLQGLQAQMAFGIRLTRELSPRPFQERIAEIRREHAAIETAVAAGDPAGARSAMAAHLQGGILRLFNDRGPP